MAHILLISRYYPPEKAAAAVCVSETAKRLVKLGYQVTVLTTVPNYPTGIVPPEYRGRILQEEMLDGVRVVRVWSYLSANEGFLRRILSQLSFGFLAPLLGWKKVGRPDVIIVGSPPLFNVIAARILASFMRRPFIFWVADLWPESAVQLGVMRNRLFIRLSERLEWTTYKKARLVWVVTERVRDLLIRQGLPPERIFLLTNGVDTVKFHPLPQDQARNELGWDGRFTLVYAGNHGLVYGMAAVLEAAEQMLDRANIHFIFLGDGARKAEMLEQARKRNLKNVTFLDPISHDSMHTVFAAADICLIPLSNMPLLETSLPLKMFEIMACARPFILGARGIASQIAEEAGAGIVIEPENAQALVSAISHLYEHPEVGEQLGRRGRIYAEARFDYDHLAAELDTKLELLLRTNGRISEAEVITSVPLQETPVPVGASAEKNQYE